MIIHFKSSIKNALVLWKTEFIKTLLSSALLLCAGALLYLLFAFLYVLSLDCIRCN